MRSMLISDIAMKLLLIALYVFNSFVRLNSLIYFDKVVVDTRSFLNDDVIILFVLYFTDI